MKKDLDPSFAISVAQDFLAKTKDLYKRSAVAGSLRRKAPVVHDIDFAVIPKGADYVAWKDKVTKRVTEIGGSVITFGAVISNFLYKGVQVNLFICPGPDSWGVTYMWATGPKGHTFSSTPKGYGQERNHQSSYPQGPRRTWVVSWTGSTSSRRNAACLTRKKNNRSTNSSQPRFSAGQDVASIRNNIPLSYYLPRRNHAGGVGKRQGLLTDELTRPVPIPSERPLTTGSAG